MEKRRKLNVELIKFLIGSMLVVGVLMLLGSSLVNNRQYRKLYNVMDTSGSEMSENFEYQQPELREPEKSETKKEKKTTIVLYYI